MSPITREARDRLTAYLIAHQQPNEPDPPKPGMVQILIDHLIAAVRAERPGDTPF